MPNALFRIETENGNMVLAHLSEKMKMMSVRLIKGERVTVEISEYDHNRGRIIEKRKYE